MPESPSSLSQIWQRITFIGLTAVSSGLMVLMLFLGALSPAAAAPAAAIHYVDGAGGSDTGNCTNSASPCQTIQYAINQSPAGDEIRVAQGTYTETIGIGVTLTLKGGYEATGWTRDITGNPTIIDANGADASVVNITPGINVTIEGFTLQGANHTSDVGGGFLINGASVVISATIIQNNVTGGGSGGGIWYEGDGVNVTLNNSQLLNNSASNSGGGIAGCCGSSQTLTLDNSVVRGNTAQNWGGGLNISSGSVNILNNSQIVSNTATTSDGGGINATPGVTLTLASSAVMSNTAGGGGGGLFINNSTASLDNVNINGNQAGGSGGGLALFQATAVFTNGQIANNTASSGGGLWQDSTSATLNSVTVQGNLANGSAFAAGGGFDTNNNSSLTLNDSVIADNVAQSTGGGENMGGAINNNFGSVAMNNTIIRNNNSQGTPVVQIYQAALTVTNSLIADNLGPGLAGTPTQGSFTNATIANNNGFGLGIGPLETGSDPAVNVTIVNSILWGNGTDYFCDTSVGTVTCTLSYSDVGMGDTTGTGNISADPLFVDDANGDYHLGVGSPAIDKGTAVGSPTDDLEGNLRDATPDMGAFEWSGYRVYLPVVIR